MQPRRLAVTLALAALSLTACGGGGGSTATDNPKKKTFPAGSTMARLQEKGSITVGTKFDQPLFGLKGLSGDVEGFDVEIAKLIANEMGIAAKNVQFVESVSKNREPFIQQGKVDMVVATYTINDKRKKVVDFAGPYYIAGQDIMVKKDDSSISSVDDLAGKTVCTVEGSTSETNLRAKAPQAKVVLFDVYTKCADAIKDGRADALTTDNVILLGLIDKSPNDFKLVGKPFTSEPYGIGIKKGDQAFRDFINDTLEKIFKDGRWKTAYENTVGKVDKTVPDPPAVDRY